MTLSGGLPQSKDSGKPMLWKLWKLWKVFFGPKQSSLSEPPSTTSLRSSEDSVLETPEVYLLNLCRELADWDDDALSDVLAGLVEEEVDIDGLGWSDEELVALLAGDTPPIELGGDAYTNKIKAPTYEPTGKRPPLRDLFNDEKTRGLLSRIDSTAGLPDEVAAFLRLAAMRHTVFHFRNIAEYYCHADADVQDLFEQSALVIIDFDKAIENGFVHMSEQIAALAGKERADDE